MGSGGGCEKAKLPPPICCLDGLQEGKTASPICGLIAG